MGVKDSSLSLANSQMPIVTLITDFGTKDGYVGAMKGVISTICANVNLVDITHEIAPMDIAGSGWALENSWWTFPAGTVHVIVVDPGVGSARKGIVVKASGHLFVGPDNGVIPWALDTDANTDLNCHSRHITNPDFMRKTVSSTFHGRDVFAACAGSIAGGRDWSEVGPTVETLVTIEKHHAVIDDREKIVGGVLVVDRFGNLITTITARLLEEWSSGSPLSDFTVSVGGVELKTGQTFADVDTSEAMVYMGSMGRLEVAVNQDSALEIFGRSVEITVQKRTN